MGITALCHLGLPVSVLLLWTCALSREVLCETEPAQPFSGWKRPSRALWLSWPRLPLRLSPRLMLLCLRKGQLADGPHTTWSKPAAWRHAVQETR